MQAAQLCVAGGTAGWVATSRAGAGPKLVAPGIAFLKLHGQAKHLTDGLKGVAATLGAGQAAGLAAQLETTWHDAVSLAANEDIAGGCDAELTRLVAAIEALPVQP